MRKPAYIGLITFGLASLLYLYTELAPLPRTEIKKYIIATASPTPAPTIIATPKPHHLDTGLDTICQVIPYGAFREYDTLIDALETEMQCFDEVISLAIHYGKHNSGFTRIGNSEPYTLNVDYMLSIMNSVQGSDANLTVFYEAQPDASIPVHLLFLNSIMKERFRETYGMDFYSDKEIDVVLIERDKFYLIRDHTNLADPFGAAEQFYHSYNSAGFNKMMEGLEQIPGIDIYTAEHKDELINKLDTMDIKRASATNFVKYPYQ